MHRNSFYNRIEEGLLPALFAQVTDHMFGRGHRPVFVEVGANDGVNSSKTIDFIRHHQWSGLAVEPVPSTFEKLRENLTPYSRVLPVNKAVTDRIGTLPFYQVIGKAEQAGN